MNAPEKNFLPDVQAIADLRNLPIQRVGIKSIVWPVTIKTATGTQPSVANLDMYVSLPSHIKGTHMSRFLEILHLRTEALAFSTIKSMMEEMLARLETTSGYIEIRLPYFIMKNAPVSGVASLMDYQVTFKVEQKNTVLKFVQEVVVPVTSLCPCSKKISAYGAHNQRSHVTISAEITEEVPLEELVRIAEQAASCEVYGILKRPDEKYVTERAYDNPKFVEDLVRDIALALNQHDRIIAYSVASENFESIHNHSAYARIEHDKRH